MRNLIVGIVIGIVIGVVTGTTVIAPRLELPATLAAEKNRAQRHKPPEPASDTMYALGRVTPKKTAIGAPRAPVGKPTLGVALAVNWRMASTFSGDLPQIGKMAERLSEQVSAISNGQFSIKIYDPGTLVPLEGMLDAVRAGAIPAAFGTPASWTNKKTAFELFTSIPFGPSALEYIAWFYGGGGQQILNQMYHKVGVHGLICGALTTEGSGWFKTPIKTADDFKGLHLAYAGLAGKVMSKLGAQISTIALSDIPAALRSGLIDGAEASQPALDFGLNLHHTAAEYYFPGWHQPVSFLDIIVNLETWNMLSNTQKKQIETVCGDNLRYGIAAGGSLQFEALKRLTAEGVQVKIWPPEILAAFRAAWHEVVAEQIAGNREFKAVWQALSQFREDYAIWREISLP